MPSIRALWSPAFLLAAFATGCSSEPSATPPATATTTTTTTPNDTPKPDAAAKDGMTAEGPAGKSDDAAKSAEAPKLSDLEIAEIKKLPEAEQALALKQIVCPASGHNLGSMEAPVKVTAEGKTFFLCCDGCKDDLAKDAKAVVAKLKN